ncbi:putative AlkP superfamily pyrophosphatase or phosphodiesterase [Aneurinibacillus soli]|uniref:Type I phosphodiesterase / nucleotide pyrophosphatase n=1 Tax=Aneurinibacillus soli TaxID=1500254 RepID=A0A0U5B060_9BACL|nr:alkaline phosphatase family protein [Aneurinibacillus soli]PYE59892.1 putative AlkP superfamily pyrophosphatase or phosphodiesterase [Aneurinibacillus soli]BAU29386.1 Type I phosphodiesterase / nucleotide pyrophosphatase [Aneurinibacillus soli]
MVWKKTIFILIDSFMPHVFEEAEAQQKVPALSFLKANGAYWNDCVTVFPTMSANIDASLMTGTYPDEHYVPGLVWYDRDKQRVVNYINGGKAVWRLGTRKCAQDVLVSLNEQHLSRDVKTIFEEAARHHRTSASLNFSIHRGPVRYSVQKPGLMKLALLGTKFDSVTGPELALQGRFFHSNGLRARFGQWNASVFKKYGINDSFVTDMAIRLVQEGRLPALTVAYMPDNDYTYHRHPDKGVDILARADRQIGRLLDAFGSWEEAVRQCRFIITGDHGQTKIGVEREALIAVLDSLIGMRASCPEKVNPEQDDLVICNNERMCFLYPLKEGVQEEVIKRLLGESRIDVLAWKEGAGVRVGRGERALFFTRGGQVRDVYGVRWTIDGDLTLLDGSLAEKEGKQIVHFGQYPDAFSRLYGALYARDGQVIAITAQPGAEFYTPSDPTHQGGASHGSLHHTDSLVPLIITGETKAAFAHPRLVDLKSYMLGCLHSEGY